MEQILKIYDFAKDLTLTNFIGVLFLCLILAATAAVFRGSVQRISAVDMLFMDKMELIQNNVFNILVLFFIFSIVNYLLATEFEFLIILTILFLVMLVIWMVFGIMEKKNKSKSFFSKKDVKLIIELSCIILLCCIASNLFCNTILGNVAALYDPEKYIASSISCALIISILEAIVIFWSFCKTDNYSYKFYYKENQELYIKKQVGKYILCSTNKEDLSTIIYISADDLKGVELVKIDN